MADGLSRGRHKCGTFQKNKHAIHIPDLCIHLVIKYSNETYSFQLFVVVLYTCRVWEMPMHTSLFIKEEGNIIIIIIIIAWLA